MGELLTILVLFGRGRWLMSRHCKASAEYAEYGANALKTRVLPYSDKRRVWSGRRVCEVDE